MSDMTITPKPRHLMVEDHTSAQALLETLATLHTEGMAVAVVLVDPNGGFSTYQFGCDEYELRCCAEALEAWSNDMDAEVLVAPSN